MRELACQTFTGLWLRLFLLVMIVCVATDDGFGLKKRGKESIIDQLSLGSSLCIPTFHKYEYGGAGKI